MRSPNRSRPSLCGWPLGSSIALATRVAGMTSQPSCAAASPRLAKPPPSNSDDSMTEQLPPSTGSSGPAPDAAAAGARLKAAREAQGMSLDYLAATLKVTPAKLEALESGDLARLPDANFARALAKAVCRQLQIDPQPVLSD